MLLAIDIQFENYMRNDVFPGFGLNQRLPYLLQMGTEERLIQAVHWKKLYVVGI